MIIWKHNLVIYIYISKLLPSHSTIHEELECAPTKACSQQQQQVRRRTRGQFTVYNQAKTKPIQPFVFNKEKGRVQQKMYPIFVHTSMIFYEFIDIGKAKYDGALNTSQAFDNKESYDPISFHSLHCKVSVFYYSRYFNAFWLCY